LSLVLPSVLLHDHLDGGLRPSTVIELAGGSGVSLPASGPGDLADWFDQSGSGSLESYLEAFMVTTGVMQTEAGLRRVTSEAMADLAADGVVYAELRFAPLQHTRAGLEPEQVVEAVLAAIRDAGNPVARLILCAMRDQEGSSRVAALAVAHGGEGVVGFDLAGPERGFPASSHREACRLAAGAVGLTIHAGEAAGVGSIADALSCGAQRLGHGIEVAEDCVFAGSEIAELGPMAAEVHSRAIPLEVCVGSNLDTKGWAPSTHPVGALLRAGFNVTLNTDNRLMSRTSMTREFALVEEHQGFSVDDLATVTRHAVAAAFCDEETKERVWKRVSTGFAEAGVTVSASW
jgi:adenosine deaminase